MDIKVNNNIAGIDVIVHHDTEDDTLRISLVEKGKKVLGKVKCGETVTIGGREYIVLDHGKDTTAIITKDFAETMVFGDNGDYRTSKVRDYCNGKFYKELAAAVGKENIVQHTIDLTADDGTGAGITCKDYVSILTTAQYRRFRRYLPAYGKWWWTATRVNADDKDYVRGVCYVDSSGVLDWIGSDYSCGVRPFCILNSSVSVS